MTLHAHVHVVRGSFRLDVALHTEPGTTLAILGPSGSGKSTLLRTLAGLHPLAAGRVELDGATLEDPRNHRRLGAQQRRIGLVFQDFRLFPHLSARDNVAFGLRSTGTSKTLAHECADDWLARMGLNGFEHRRPDQLSGGQAQRVALARALCTQPRLLLLDEPLAALDVTTRSEVRNVLRRQLDTFPGPTLLVTHDPLDAMALADQLLILENGQVTQQGSPAHVAQRPASAYVAQLVGLNLFRGMATRGVLHVIGGGHLVIADSNCSGAIMAVVRPNSVHVQTTQPSPSSARNTVTGRITAMEALGDRVRLTVASSPPLLADITTHAVADLRLTPGDNVWLTLKATDIDTYPDGAM